MEVPEIVLPAADIISLGKVIAELKDSLAKSTNINAFIIDKDQPFYLQDRSVGGPYEVVCIVPQPETSGAGEIRDKHDTEWLTGVVACAIANIDSFYLDGLEDIEFKQSDKVSIDDFLYKRFPKIKVNGTPYHSNDFSFDDSSKITYRLEAHIKMKDTGFIIFTFTILRMDTRYVVVIDYVGED